MRRYPKYKDSGIEWLGEIPEHWTVKKLKCCDLVIMGQSPRSEDYNHTCEGIPFLQGNADFTELYPNPRIWCKYGNKIAKKGDILLSVRAPIGAINIADQDYIIGRGLCAIRSDKTYPIYLYFLSLALYEELNSIGTGSTYRAISIDDIKNVSIPQPSKVIQQSISKYLNQKTNQIDTFIKKKQTQIDLLKEYRTAIINEAVTKGLNPNVKMKDSGIEWLGEIPENWETIKTKYLFRLVTDAAPENNNFELLSLYTDIGVRPRKEMEERGNKASTTDGYWIVKKGDIIVNKLLTWMGAIGISEYDGVTSPAYDILQKICKLNEYYYNYLFRCGIYLPEFKRRSRGIMDMRLRLYFDQFGQIPLIFPPLEEQKAIVTFLDCNTAQIDTFIKKQQDQITRLQQYRTSLISEVVTGKIDVRDEVQ